MTVTGPVAVSVSVASVEELAGTVLKLTGAPLSGGATAAVGVGARSVVGVLYQPLEVWRSFATDVRGRALDAGHFLAEERPRETLAELEQFLAC